MKERVNIQYSINIEDLPPETHRLFKQSVDQLTALTDNVKTWNVDPGNIMSIDTMSKIDGLRQNIASLDYMLSDVHNLVASFINYKTKPPENETTNQQPQENTQPHIMPETPDLAELQKRIEVFRNSLDNTDMVESPNEVTS